MGLDAHLLNFVLCLEAEVDTRGNLGGAVAETDVIGEQMGLAMRY